MKATELKSIIKAATARKSTAYKRLEKAQSKQDSVKCDQIRAIIAYNNQIIQNASTDLETV
jgi:hypothetical protein